MSSKSVPPVAHCEVSELHTVAQKEAAEKKVYKKRVVQQI